MKKAYVKPVFLAEKFVAEQNYAAKGCGTWAWDKAQIQPGMELCYKEKKGEYESDGHKVGNGNAVINTYSDDYNMYYWDYAGRTMNNDGSYNYSDCYLFNREVQECDFVWNNTNEEVYGWNSSVVSERTVANVLLGAFSNFFFGNSATISQHQPQYGGRLIPS